MHPTATYLALRGCVCLKLRVEGYVRIAPKFAAFVPALYAKDQSAGVRLRRLGGAEQYVAADWSEFTGWDDITEEMIEGLLGDT